MKGQAFFKTGKVANSHKKASSSSYAACSQCRRSTYRKTGPQLQPCLTAKQLRISMLANHLWRKIRSNNGSVIKNVRHF